MQKVTWPLESSSASLHGAEGITLNASLAHSERRKLPPHCLQHQCIYNVLRTAARDHAPPPLCKLLSSFDTPEISCVACRFYVILLDCLFPRICLKPRYSTQLSLKQPLHTQRSPVLFYRLVRALEITTEDWTSASTKYDRLETYEVQKL